MVADPQEVLRHTPDPTVAAALQAPVLPVAVHTVEEAVHIAEAADRMAVEVAPTAEAVAEAPAEAEWEAEADADKTFNSNSYEKNNNISNIYCFGLISRGAGHIFCDKHFRE